MLVFNKVFSLDLRLLILPVYNIFYLYNIVYWCLKYINKTLKIYIVFLFGADPDRIGLLGKPPAVEHSFPSKSQ
jgi:hypothetical protein